MKPPDDLCLIWQVPLATADVARLPLNLLRPDELERAQRLRDPRDRERFMGCRSALRAILGDCLECDPETLQLLRGAHGRPELLNNNAIQFNVTHSGDLGLIAISTSAPLGVDVEEVREMKNALQLARRYLTSEECAEVECSDDASRSVAFLTCWTRKEALLKSAGDGLTRDPRNVRTGGKNAEIMLEWPLGSSTQVRVISIDVGNDFLAACATSARIERIEVRRFTSV